MPKTEEAPLVGRDAELALLKRTIDEAASGAGRTIFVTGEGGIGKTRLVSAAAHHAAEKGWNVAIGRSYPVESGVPYALFADALMPVVRSLEQSALTVLTRGGSAELGYIFPNLAGPGDRDRSSAGAAPSELKARLLWNFSQFLGRLASRQPLLVVLENLQWADASSLELLHFVSRQSAGQKVVVLGTYNETERDLNPILRTTEQSLLKLGLLTVERLGALRQ
ncbi:MAG: ATP-binding protein, partial [bacterium]